MDADLSPSQLVLIGAAQSVVSLLFEVPAGVVADTISRKWSLVVSHALMGTAMLATGLVTAFPLLVGTQMLWGLSWTFASGSDVAWVTDELNDPGRISKLLVRAGRADLTGAAAGMVGLGALAALTGRSTAMVVAGAGMLALGVYVVARFRERRFVRVVTRRWAASWSILVGGVTLVARSRMLLLMFAATFLVNGASDAAGRLNARRLVDIGLPTSPVVWLAALGVLGLLAGAGALQVVEARIDDGRSALRGYALAAAAGALGLLLLAAAPDALSGSFAVLLVAGIAVPLTRTIGTIWVNRRTSAEIRATVHSLLAQAEYAGEIVCGIGIALLARLAGLSPALVGCAVLFAAATALVARVAGYGALQSGPSNVNVAADPSDPTAR